MTKGLISQEHLTAIANAIRQKLGVQTTYLPSEMAEAIASITGGGGSGGSGQFLHGTDEPSANLGSDGDLYFRCFDDDGLVPSDYTRVSYIEGTGAQYINTAISSSTSNLKLVTEACVTQLTGGNGAALFGGIWSTSGFFLVIYNGAFRWHSGGKSIDVPISLNSWQTIEADRSAITVDGTAYSLPSPSGSDNQANISLFYVGNTAGVSGTSKASARMKTVDFYSGDTKIASFVPCVRDSDSAVGMYDTVGGAFYGNAGTGAFITGDTLSDDEILAAYVKVNGTWVNLIGADVDDPKAPSAAKNILSGTDTPTSADGSDGDVYLRYVDGELFDLNTFAQYVNSSMSVTKTPTSAAFAWSSGDRVGAQVYKQIDLTDIDSISVDVSVGSSHYDISQTWLSPCVFIENTWNPANTWLGTSVNPNWSTQTPNSDTHAVIDTTEYTGTYYVVLTAYGCNATFSNLTFDDGSGMDAITASYLKVSGSWLPLIGQDIDDVDTEGSGGGIAHGTTAPTASQGSDGDLYVQEHPLPSSVNFVEYLQSSGTQYIDTGIIANQGTDITCVCEYKGNDFIIGCRTGSATSASKSLMITGSGSGLCAYKSSGSDVVGNYASSTSVGTKCTSIIKTINEGASSRSLLVPRRDNATTYAKSVSDFTADYSQVLFGLKQGSTPNKSNAKLYRVTYYQNGAPIADYLPCLDGNGVACMWDNVAQEYVYNDGTGDFAYGNTVTPDPLGDMIWAKQDGAWVVIGEAEDVN